jgi:hypothetical protein
MGDCLAWTEALANGSHRFQHPPFARPQEAPGARADEHPHVRKQELGPWLECWPRHAVALRYRCLCWSASAPQQE